MYKWFVIFLGFNLSAQTQIDNSFVFKDLDNAVIQIWFSDDSDKSDMENAYSKVSYVWPSIRMNILNKRIMHFDLIGFVSDQDKRIKNIGRLITSNQLENARKEAHILIEEFREIRSCFTLDEYQLDQLMDSYDSYLLVHDIIHDEMMGLYEWTEFVWHIDQLKCKVQNLENSILVIDAPKKNNAIVIALERVNTCLSTLDKSLGDAYRPDFEIPCNDLNAAFMDLFIVYSKRDDML